MPPKGWKKPEEDLKAHRIHRAIFGGEEGGRKKRAIENNPNRLLDPTRDLEDPTELHRRLDRHFRQLGLLDQPEAIKGLVDAYCASKGSNAVAVHKVSINDSELLSLIEALQHDLKPLEAVGEVGHRDKAAMKRGFSLLYKLISDGEDETQR